MICTKVSEEWSEVAIAFFLLGLWGYRVVVPAERTGFAAQLTPDSESLALCCAYAIAIPLETCVPLLGRTPLASICASLDILELLHLP